MLMRKMTIYPKKGQMMLNQHLFQKKTSSSADDQVLRSNETGNDHEGEKNKTSSSDISEDMIKEAIEKRTSYFRKNSEYVFSTTSC